MHVVYQKSYPLIYLKFKKKYNHRCKKINEILPPPISMYIFHGRPLGFFYIGQILAFGALPCSLIGDSVWLLKGGEPYKLANQYEGPYTIIEIVNDKDNVKIKMNNNKTK